MELQEGTHETAEKLETAVQRLRPPTTLHEYRSREWRRGQRNHVPALAVASQLAIPWLWANE